VELKIWSRLSRSCTAALAVATVAVTAAGAASAHTSALPKTLTVGVLDSLTGSAAFCGIEEVQGAALAVKEANSMHFLGKTKLGMKVVDDRSTLDASVSGINQLVNAKVPVVVGPCISGGAQVVDPIATKAGMPMVITTASAADVSADNLFRAGIPQPRYASKVITLLKNRGVKRVAVFYDSAVPTNADAVWHQTQERALKAYHIDIADVEAAPVSTSGMADFTSQVAKMMQSKPDAIGLILQGVPNLTVVKQLRDAGFNGPIWGAQGMLAPYFLGAGSVVNNVFVSVSFGPGVGPKSSQKFAKAFQKRYHRLPTELGAHGYDAMWMAIRGLKIANSTDHAKVIKALSTIKKMPAAQGNLRFNSIGDAVGSGFVAEVKNGAVVGVAK
jgi:branched-chain amino acid transport system substrate-binding protein